MEQWQDLNWQSWPTIHILNQHGSLYPLPHSLTYPLTHNSLCTARSCIITNVQNPNVTSTINQWQVTHLLICTFFLTFCIYQHTIHFGLIIQLLIFQLDQSLKYSLIYPYIFSSTEFPHSCTSSSRLGPVIFHSDSMTRPSLINLRNIFFAHWITHFLTFTQWITH